MEGTKPRTVSSLGMFDLLKGIGMLAIVFAHTAELYPLGTNDVTPFAFALFAYREALMAAFFIASGYGFRKRSIHKCIEQQLKSLGEREVPSSKVGELVLQELKKLDAVAYVRFASVYYNVDNPEGFHRLMADLDDVEGEGDKH